MTHTRADDALPLVWLFTLEAWRPSSHCRNSLSRNLQCLPILSAGISPHLAQRQRVRVDTPSHLDTAAVVSNDSGLDDSTFPSLDRQHTGRMPHDLSDVSNEAVGSRTDVFYFPLLKVIEVARNGIPRQVSWLAGRSNASGIVKTTLSDARSLQRDCAT